MISKLKNGKKVVGLKQTAKAASRCLAQSVWIAEDADPVLTAGIAAICEEKGIALHLVPTMKELGAACGISVGASAAALLRE